MNIIPRPEHPFPQMKREKWENLNGEWEFEMDFGRSGRERKVYEQKSLKDKIIVPFCPESELSGIGYKDFMPAVWYKRNFSISDEQHKGRVVLHFGAVDYHSIVYINGCEVGSHKGGYSSFAFDITPFVKEGENTVVVFAEDECRSGLQPKGKQCSTFDSRGCDYTRTTGIWQTVWLEFTPKQYIKNVKYYPNINEGLLHIHAQVVGSGVFQATASYQGRVCGQVAVKTNGDVQATIRLDELHLWEIGAGRLYDLQLQFGEDVVESYFGMREVSLDGMKFLLNGKSVFQRLVLDQGFYPDGIYTAPSDEALQKDIKLSMDMGFNGARLHQKVFEPRFLYHCDKMGYIVWGEHANWGIDLSQWNAVQSFLPEWMDVVDRDFNHPAIIGWCPFNETWDYERRAQINDIVALVYHTTKRLDTTRPCIDTSGNFHVITDIYDIHDYEQNVEVFRSHYQPMANGGAPYENFPERQQYKGQPYFVSEYGGIKWIDNTSDSNGWGYGQGPETEEEYIERYKSLTHTLLDNPNICAFCFTQLYDIEQEKNGLYTYERKAKFDPAIIKAINTKKAAIED
jgi:beta-galactosidase/beta-glucuronidase